MKKFILLQTIIFCLFLVKNELSAQVCYTTPPVGSIAFTSMSTDDPDIFSFVVLQNLAAGAVINFTDGGWLAAGGFRPGEGALAWTAPATGVNAGTVITITSMSTSSFLASQGTVTVFPTATPFTVNSFQLAAGGDQITAFTGTGTMPTPIAAINLSGSVWQADATNSNTSALPTGLTNGTNAIAVNDNAGANDNVSFTGPSGSCATVATTNTASALLTLINNASNWTGTATAPGPVACSNFSIPCNITAATLSNISVCNNNGTPANTADDFYTADVVITFTNPPAIGNLTLSGTGSGSAVGGSIASCFMGSITTYTFTNQQFSANNTTGTITVQFPGSTTACTFTNSAIPAVVNCSTSTDCAIISMTVSNLICVNAGNDSDPSNDYYTGDVVVTYNNPPAAGTLNISGSAILGSTPAANLMSTDILDPTTFTGISFAPNTVNGTINVAFSDSPACTLSVSTVNTAGTCSIVICTPNCGVFPGN